MPFTSSTYTNFVSTSGPAHTRFFPQYTGDNPRFDIIIIGSGIGGGVLADELADRLGTSKRILVLEAGSFIYPTHVYNICRFPNSRLAKHFACDTFWQHGQDQSHPEYIGEKPQLNLGGRSVFWSGLIPTIQPWELDFFPAAVRNDLANNLLQEAGIKMNESISMGTVASQIVAKLNNSPLKDDFIIRETPRALHQPYLAADGTPKDRFYTEPTGVFNTAELLINQAGLISHENQGKGPGLHLLLNHFVEDVQHTPGGGYQLITSHTLDGSSRTFFAPTVVLAGGSIESPKLLRRSSSLFNTLPSSTRELVGVGLTDHPTSHELTSLIDHIDSLAIPKDVHAKIILYSRGRRDGQNQVRYPFNVEVNINHEYWHLRENDPSAPGTPIQADGASRMDIKISYGNCLDDNNRILPPPPFGYVPEIKFRNQHWADYLSQARFPALAGWNKSNKEIFDLMNAVAIQLFTQFSHNGQTARPIMKDGEESVFNKHGNGFGYGTVHHAAGSLRMPYRPQLDAPFAANSVVDEDLCVRGASNLYVCDMSVMPFSSAANPVRTLVALALRLANKLGN
jgi:hypothetical protein